MEISWIIKLIEVVEKLYLSRYMNKMDAYACCVTVYEIHFAFFPALLSNLISEIRLPNST